MQQRIYDYIAACIQTQGYPPSVREIGEAVGLRSPSTVHFHLKKLADAGVIEIGAGKGRAITLTHPAAPSVSEPEEPADRVPIVGNAAVPFWLRSASRTTSPSTPGIPGTFTSPCGSGANPC